MRKELSKKIIVVSFVISIQVLGLHLFFDNENFISSISASQVKEIYLPSFMYKIDNLNTNSITGFATHDTGVSSARDEKNIAQSVPVLLYHGIVEKPDGHNVLLEDFRDQMFALKDAGYQTITLEQFHDHVKYGKELPENSFLITFDDGRKDSYYPADPILEALDYHAVIFVITKYSIGEERAYYLGESELKKMLKSGRWDVQSHSYDGHGHPVIDPDGTPGYFFSDRLWLDDEQRIETEEEYNLRIEDDLSRSKKDIEDSTKRDVIGFAFPFGEIGERLAEFKESDLHENVENIYPLAFIQYSPSRGFAYNIPMEDSFLIKRINVNPQMSSSNLLKILETGKAKKLPYSDDFESYDGWIKGWGRLTFRQGIMAIGENRQNDNLVFLDGTYLWENYTYNVEIRSLDGETVSLVARYNDANNYIACEYADRHIRIKQRSNNKVSILAEERPEYNLSRSDLKIGMKVNGDYVECLMDNISIVNSQMTDPALSRGGIGIKTSSPLIDESGVIVRRVNVEAI